MKERFEDKNIYTSLKKLYISNLELPYPSVKVRVDKTIREKPKGELMHIEEPHVVVLVHGLGATSSAFSEF